RSSAPTSACPTPHPTPRLAETAPRPRGLNTTTTADLPHPNLIQKPMRRTTSQRSTRVRNDRSAVPPNASLARHLRPTAVEGTPGPRYWGERSPGLTEATLIDLDLSNCELHQVNFEKATF